MWLWRRARHWCCWEEEGEEDVRWRREVHCNPLCEYRRRGGSGGRRREEREREREREGEERKKERKKAREELEMHETDNTNEREIPEAEEDKYE